jgi:hypothetical protein
MSVFQGSGTHLTLANTVQVQAGNKLTAYRGPGEEGAL